MAVTHEKRMEWNRNVDGLHVAARAKSEATRGKVEKALREMTKPLTKPDEKRPSINFKTVAEWAGVSQAWLYRPKNKDIADRIRELRNQQSQMPKVVIPPQERATDASKDALIVALRKRVKQQEEEIREMRRQLEVAYGLLHTRGQQAQPITS